jgi:hypothetical protein
LFVFPISKNLFSRKGAKFAKRFKNLKGFTSFFQVSFAVFAPLRESDFSG